MKLLIYSSIHMDMNSRLPILFSGIEFFKIILDFDIPIVLNLAIWEPQRATCCALLICARHSVSASILQDTPDSSWTSPLLNLNLLFL